ncbi:putative E3 ubiquitin-protein ligase LIN-1 [Cynara cardunculus var. scolymus]|uniref:putative E3 ubiquitin-protein ligase LIN-1 n=1 Tax=Cynara cardunculus var. scolymus TaxID=59895 RepID=UPI000D630C0D|nr:putative E3 ubiquitin-protein ligase LIN-1 [Cynara cardunculus var. scolymus]
MAVQHGVASFVRHLIWPMIFQGCFILERHCTSTLSLFTFPMEPDDIVRSLITIVGSFVQDRLLDQRKRATLKEQCGERLAAEDESNNKDTEFRYSDQAVLANLDWGMDAFEEAINTSNIETKMARLDYAEKMLQVCAMLNTSDKTAGVPNCYLSAWAHLNLSYLWKLRNNATNVVLHVLEMFSVDPFFSRIDFAPELWKTLFLPHMSSIVGWYSEERHRIMMDLIPDSADLSFNVDFDLYLDESLVFSMRPDQADKLQNLEKLYGQSLDDNTRLYTNYFKDCMNYSSATSKRPIPMLPIAEPPMTPLHEVNRKIPDYVKFSPILPKSAGFSPVQKAKENTRETSSLSATNTSSENLLDSDAWNNRVGIPEETEDSEKVANAKQEGNGKEEARSILRLQSTRDMDFKVTTSLPTSPQVHHDFSINSPDLNNESKEQPKSVRKIFAHGDGRNSGYANVNNEALERSFTRENDSRSPNFGSPQQFERSTQSRPPKDFVCPITTQIFSDPVTLETGQTYERKAIEEWMKRGNTTCPITRQPLSANVLPKTNYVLKRLITSWKEQHPDLAHELSYPATPRSSYGSPSSGQIESTYTSKTSNLCDDKNNGDDCCNYKPRRFMQATVATSPTSVISQAAVEAIISGLKPFISCLCTSEDLKECEEAVLAIARMWKESNADPGAYACLSTSEAVNGFMDVLSASLSREALAKTVYILSELLVADDNFRDVLTSVDFDFECLAALLKNGLPEAAVLIYVLKPTFSQMSAHNLVPQFIQIITSKYEDSKDHELLMNPKDAAIELVEQVLIEGDENSRSSNALSIISADAVPILVMCLDKVDIRQSVLFILLCCIHADKSCRNLIANRIDLCLVLELFHAGNENLRGMCIDFLSELVQLNRRTLCNQILQIIKDEGAFSTMHTLLIYLQNAPMEQQPVVASLLLQLDILVEPRKMSIYREEAIETLIDALLKKDFPNLQLMALDALSTLSGHLSSSGKSYTEAWLLNLAGFSKPYEAFMKNEKLKMNQKELTETMEKATSSWEKRVAFVLCNHEKGLIFNALEECLKSKSVDMAKKCLITATWLVYMLYNLPDTGVRDAAHKSLLHQFIYILQSSKNLEEKILATVALRSFISDQGALGEIGGYAEVLYKTLRKLKRSYVVVSDIMKTLMNLPSVNAAEMWSASEGLETDSSMNGEVLSLLDVKGRVLSSHSDGTIKVWDAGKRGLRLIQEVREHAKAVTCLYIPPSCDKFYSGSLDKTIRIWVIKPEGIRCIQVHDVKEAVHGLTADANFAYFFSQGAGFKVFGWSGITKHINLKQSVKCLDMIGDKVYCGCSDFSIQEADLQKSTTTSFYSGTRKLLGKQSINSISIHDDLLFAGGTSVDGTAGKVFSVSSRAVVGSLSSGFDIHYLAVNNELIFGGTKNGIIEVWLKERLTRVVSIKMSGIGKITSMASNAEGDMLFTGSSDGKIQAWELH